LLNLLIDCIIIEISSNFNQELENLDDDSSFTEDIEDV